MGCEWRARIRQAKRRGVPVVVIDPRRTETARQLGTQWLPVRPGTDSALMLAVLHVLVTEGWSTSRSWPLMPQASRRCAGACWAGPAARPPRRRGPRRSAARRPPTSSLWPGSTRAAKPAALIPGLSIQRTWGGEEPVRLGDRPAGGHRQSGPPRAGRPGRRTGAACLIPTSAVCRCRPTRLPPTIPANDWADAVLRGRAGGYPDIHAALNVGGNYVCQGADVAKSVRALQSLEFSVCHDLFLTATARQCDVVLPATHWLERSDIVFTLANFVLFSHKVAEPPGEARDDYDILADVAERDGLRGGVHGGQGRGRLAARVRGATRRSPTTRSSGAPASTSGADQERVGLAAFAADPAAHPLSTPSGRVELSGAACAAAGLSEVPEARVLPVTRRAAAAAGDAQGAPARALAAGRAALVPAARRPRPVDAPARRRRARASRTGRAWRCAATGAGCAAPAA